MNKLTAKQLLMINQKLTGDNAEIPPDVQSLLETIASAPYEQNERALYIYRDIIAKAAKLGCVLLQKRPFKHKNSQTAILSILTFLELNGIKLIGYENDLSELMAQLDSDDIEQVCQWINAHKAEDSIADL